MKLGDYTSPENAAVVAETCSVAGSGVADLDQTGSSGRQDLRTSYYAGGNFVALVRQGPETHTEPEGPVKKRRKRNSRIALETICDQLEDAINAPGQKVAKAIDGLKQVAAIRLRLLDYDTEKKDIATTQELETLKAQHDKDTAEIARLRIHVRPTTITLQDPETPGLKKEVESLKAFTRYLASEYHGDPAKMSIAVILKFGRDCKEYVTALGINWDSYFSWLNDRNAMAEANLRASINPPENEDLHTMLCRPMVSAEFAVAALAVCHQVDVAASPVRRVNGAIDYSSLAAVFVD